MYGSRIAQKLIPARAQKCHPARAQECILMG